MRPPTIFFDLGGTIFGHPDIISVLVQKMTGREADKDTITLVWKRVDEVRSVKNAEAFCRIADNTVQALKSISAEFGYSDISAEAPDLIMELGARQCYLYPETIPVLDRLLNQGVQMVMATDNDLDLLEIQMARLGFGKYFVDQCVSESVRAYKPADLFISYLRKYSLDREDRCYFIGDTKNDIIAGQKLGVHTVLVDRQGHGNSHSAEYVVRSLNELLTILGME